MQLSLSVWPWASLEREGWIGEKEEGWREKGRNGGMERGSEGNRERKREGVLWKRWPLSLYNIISKKIH